MWQLKTQLFASSYDFEASYNTLVTSLSKKSSIYQLGLEE